MLNTPEPKREKTFEQQLRVKLTPIISSTTFILSLLIVIVVSFFLFFSGLLFTPKQTQTHKKKTIQLLNCCPKPIFFSFFFSDIAETPLSTRFVRVCPLLFNQDNDDHHHRRQKFNEINMLMTKKTKTGIILA